MSTPRKMSEKNSSPEISPKSTQGEIEVTDTKKFMSSPEMNIADPGMLFHNIVMRLTDHSSMGDALWFEVGEDLGRFSINEFCLITGMKYVGSTHLIVVESQLITIYFSMLRGVSREHLKLQLSNAANLDNDDDAVKLSLLYLTFFIPLSNANLVKIDPRFFTLADNIADFNDFPWGVLSWESTRTAICNSVENKVSSKRRLLKKNDKVHYSVAGFPHALLVWAYETLPTIALRFSSNYEYVIPRMLSWTTADNVKFDDVMSAFTEVGEKQWLKTTPPHIGTDSQDDVILDSALGTVADMGVQAAMEFLTANKVIVSREDVKAENNKIPKKKRVRLSRLGQRPSASMPHDGSPSKTPNTLIHALPSGLADEPPKEILEEFREWFPKGLLKKTLTGKRPPRYSKMHDTLDKPHELGCMQVGKKTWYYELATTAVWLWNEHIDVAFYYLDQAVPRTETTEGDNGRHNFYSKMRVQNGASWFDINTVLMPIHFEGLKYWALVKLDLTNWTIEVYDSLEHEGYHNSQVREGMEGLSKFIPFLVEKNSLFEFKRRDPPGNYPIPVTIMKDIPKQANVMKGSELFVVKWFDDVHTCSIEIVQGHHRQAKSWMIGECVKAKYLDPTISLYRPSEIMRDMQAEFGVSFNYLRAWRGKEAALTSLRGDDAESYKCTFPYMLIFNLVYPDAAFGICVQHLAANSKTRYKDFKGPLKTYFDGASRSYLLSEFHRHMKSIRGLNPDMHRYLVEADPTKALLQRWFVERREEALKITSKVAPKAEKLIRTHFSIGLKETFEYAVTSNTGQIWIVDMSERTCTCRRFQIDQILCPHAMIVCNHRRIDPYNYCSNYYTKDYLYACYAHVVHPIGRAEGWDVSEEVSLQIVNPPTTKCGPGRPQVRRIPSQGEEHELNRCGRCNGYGHNRQTCTNSVPLRKRPTRPDT
ncbi:hypothetical protein TIFTF001_030932 [Ficus carica]|uniref:SWIM-type domain-containing protein n=1 Tax=Ficus carica TaxID=3494 RepID=A0AA88DVG6_FICCA|nr:hypothetical protein TIFTF001_030932 [Ficus carica]